MTRFSVSFFIFLAASLKVHGQETTPLIPTPAPLPAEAEVRQALPFDPEVEAKKFTPGMAKAYSEVLVRGPYLAMTFDDGPSAEYTPTLLDELARRKIHATFFLVGQNAAEFPQIVKRIVDEGHEVANHSWSHPAFAKMSDAAVRSQLERTQEAIKSACGVTPTLMRPPYGSVTKSQKAWINDEFHLKVIMWSIDPLDWKKPGESVVRSRIVSAAQGGSIILAHDIHGSTVHAMPQTFDQLLAKGFQFVTVSELLAMEIPAAAKTMARLQPAPASVPAVPPASTPVVGTPLPTPIPLP